MLELTTPRRTIRTGEINTLHTNKETEPNPAFRENENTSIVHKLSVSTKPTEMNGVMMTAETTFIDIEETNVQDEGTSSIPETPVVRSSVSARIEALQRLEREQNLRDSEGGGANHSRRRAFLPSGHRMEPQFQGPSSHTNSALLQKVQTASGAL